MLFRSVHAEQAVATVLAEIDRLGLRVDAELVGPTMRVRLLRDGTPVALGYGKGRGAQGTVSAHAEALERYLMSARDNRRFSSHNTVLLAASTVAAQPALAADLVIQRWAAEFPAAPAACAAYHGPAGTVRYPTFLADPRYHRAPVPGDSVEPYRSLLRYSSSLGTAAGLTVTEAVYHGLCELVEHDALSQALLRWFVAGRPEVDVVEPAALPPPLRSLHDEATAAAGASVHLLDLTTDLGVPVYLAVSGPDLLGAGASTWGSYAAERALSELIQTATLAGETTGTPPADRLAAWPALRRCVRMPVDELGPKRSVALRGDTGDGTAADGLARAGRMLGDRGVRYHVCELAPADSLIAVATTIAPGLERFSLVRHGVPVIPTGRGHHLWPAPQPAT
ncbi:YcaO-like family protein [Actinoplanes sp. ATCC 53533]|uniref:YcaO-like family protein n=1 Tax=Actinoplanes sp. ATCC 53533 TaxID=1288362 RepID=UPI000F7B244D|nr:YcaO-like family protein [Actinoplanes sp. ATCC 53533]